MQPYHSQRMAKKVQCPVSGSSVGKNGPVDAREWFDSLQEVCRAHKHTRLYSAWSRWATAADHTRWHLEQPNKVASEPLYTDYTPVSFQCGMCQAFECIWRPSPDWLYLTSWLTCPPTLQLCFLQLFFSVSASMSAWSLKAGLISRSSLCRAPIFLECECLGTGVTGPVTLYKKCIKVQNMFDKWPTNHIDYRWTYHTDNTR